MILQQLSKVGLNEREAVVYMALLELGEATIAQITKKAQVKRSTVYDMLELLKEKRLVSQSRIKKRPLFYAENPKKIVEDLDEKKRGMELAMPELISMMNLLDKKPKIRYFEGTSSVREIFEDTLNYPSEAILSWVPYPYLNLGEDYFWDYYGPARIKKKIWMHALMPDTPGNRTISEKMGRYLVTTRFMTGKSFLGFDIEIKLYSKTRVGIISYTENLGIIIESKKIFDGVRALFETMWENSAR